MGFTAVVAKNGITLQSDGSGVLEVVEGKARRSKQKLKVNVDELVKGDEVEGVEFIFKLNPLSNINFVKWVPQPANAQGKSYPKLEPADPLTSVFEASFFLAGSVGAAYLAIFENAEKFGLPANIADGFKANLELNETKVVLALAKGLETIPAAKLPNALMPLFDDAEAVTSTLSFPVPATGGSFGGGKSAQSEADRISDRVAFIKAAVKVDSPEQILFVELNGLISSSAKEFTFVDLLDLLLK